MNITEISSDYSVASQITVENVQTIKDLGFRAIMCNRPDDEDPDQPTAADIRAEAERLGLKFAWVPVVTGKIQPQNILDFSAEIQKLPKPVLSYCRTSARCSHLFEMAGF